MENKLRFSREAERFEESIVLGNGHVGCSVYGGVHVDRVSLNDDALWSGVPDDRNEKNCSASYVKMRDLALRGRYHEAERVFERELSGKFGESYMPLGAMYIRSLNAYEAKNYRRELDVRKAVATVKYEADGATFLREYFCSYPLDAFYVRLSCSQKKLSVAVTMKSELKSFLQVSEDGLILTGRAPSHAEPEYRHFENPISYSEDEKQQGISFCALLGVARTDGEIKTGKGELIIENASEIVLCYASKTNFERYDVFPVDSKIDYLAIAKEKLDAALKVSYESALKAHIADVSEIFDRTSFTLCGEESDEDTDVRLKNPEKLKRDLGLYELYFNFGKYLAIASSRKGTQATNLQGIWNESVTPPWSSNYTVNINTEMNYFGFNALGLSDLQEPLDSFVVNLAKSGERTAKEYYGVSGACAFHNVDIWLHCNPVGMGAEGCGCYAYYNASLAWLTRHLYEKYEFTKDLEYLKGVYPAIKSAAEFFLNILVEDENGYLICAPSTSPENRFLYEGEYCGVEKTSAMVMSIISEVFQNAESAARVQGVDEAFAKKLAAARERLLPLSVADNGKLVEYSTWHDEGTYVNHRHVSNCYALYPSCLVTPDKNADICEAIRKTLISRTDESTGWSTAWKISLWARLKDGDHALKLFDNALKIVRSSKVDSCSGGVFPNLLDAHPPFQIDGNFGAMAAVAEMVLQQNDDFIDVLAALPKAFSEGEFKGLRIKGGGISDIKWKNNRLCGLTILTDKPREIKIRAFGKIKRYELKKGENVLFSEKE